MKCDETLRNNTTFYSPASLAKPRHCHAPGAYKNHPVGIMVQNVGIVVPQNVGIVVPKMSGSRFKKVHPPGSKTVFQNCKNVIFTVKKLIFCVGNLFPKMPKLRAKKFFFGLQDAISTCNYASDCQLCRWSGKPEIGTRSPTQGTPACQCCGFANEAGEKFASL